MPADAIEPASVFVAGFRGDVHAEGTEIEPNGSIVAFDSSGAVMAEDSLDQRN
jgi:hypothetical protein